jgi:hypothetical protein
MKREIYSIGFNKSITAEGLVRMYGYTLGIINIQNSKTPENIEIVDDYVIVTFTDKSRHLIPLVGVEIMDRVVEPKKKETDARNNKDRTDEKTT